MNEQEMRRQFQELLPWHVNGTLDPAQREWIDEYVRSHPEAKAELTWSEALQSRVKERVPTVAADAGWNTLQKRIRQERAANAPSMMERISNLLAGLRFTPAMATAAAVILVQAGVIGTLLRHSGVDDANNADVYRNIRSATYTGPVVEVTFKETATEKEMRRLLMSVNGNVIGGPGQLGSYLVFVSTGKVNEAAKILQASPLVDSANVLEHMQQKAD
jgi:anti-sigma factor RsiW